jgi:FADH2 O2-dependent halogenase
LSRSYDIAVVGSGFAGSVTAMIARRLGHSVVLLERGTHPRVVIGESSTPLSNLLLEDLAIRYDLPALKPLAKWGSWQRSYPRVACGLKRGFTFYHHVLGRPDGCDPEHRNQLLVAASPHDQVADTHWYRADVDEMLVRQAESLGVDYVDEVRLESAIELDYGMSLGGTRRGADVAFRAGFVVDATGPRGFLHRALQLREAALPGYPATQALYSHFSGVRRLAEIDPRPLADSPPYPVDDAAVHHVFDGGWIWVLRFANGITSAGVAATERSARQLQLARGEKAWDDLLRLIPALREQFRGARAERPFTHMQRLSFMSGVIAGDNWAMLPSAAGFVDPLLSTGFPLTLLGVARLADIFEQDWHCPRLRARLERYGARTRDELLATSRLVASLYANMHNFPVFRSLALLYFAAASFSEAARRLDKPQLAPSFLLHDHPTFGPALADLLKRAAGVRSEEESAGLIEDILRAIEPIDVAGLSNARRRNWYPVDARDLLCSARKLEASREEMARLLDRCGFRSHEPRTGQLSCS